MNEDQFYQKSKEVLNWLLETSPVLATQMGEHSWDDKLADYSKEALEEQLEQFKKYLQEFERADVNNFSKDVEIDYTLMVQSLKSFIRSDEELESHVTNPNFYIDEVFGGIMTLIMKDFAPLEERIKSVGGRLQDIPELIAHAKQNLEPKRVPEVWINTALEQLKMAPGLLKHMLPQMAAEHVPEIEDKFYSAGQKAADAIQNFTRFLKKEVKPVAEGDFAVGEEMFNKLLLENHMVDYDAEQLLKIGWEIFEDTREQMNNLSNEIDPDKTTEKIMETAKADHPAPEKLLDAYRESMNKSKNFVKESEIATIPENEKLTIIETPEYLWPIIPYAAYMQPGIFEEEMEGLFLVTPANPDASAEEKEKKLKGHYNAKLPITTLHEGYPGHHLQLVWAVSNGTDVRKMGMFLSTLFIEGWAFYCEEMMEDMGYIDAPIQKLGRLSDQLWRAARIILDVKLHCKGMQVEEAVEFLVDKCQLERGNALAEVRRYSSSPTQPQSYLMGKREILKIIDKYMKENPDKSLKEIHNDILAAGSLPPKLMHYHLLG